VKSSRYSCGRSVLNHTTHSAVASSTWLTSRHGPWRRLSSFLNEPTVVSASALFRVVNALDPVGDQRTVRVTHPFHPWRGREFVFLAVRQTWSEDRVFFVDGNGRQFSLPVGWTDAADPDAFVTMAAGRSPFRFADLVELRRLIDDLSG
jgi:hypothetical protein